ncbi:MAG: ribbon-helix-helix protein, CopG family [Clostridiales bacterium]|jgi:antitoxin component of RelBE/YafQ-DinJ toxin-antitoxin module|nr:ribbon-helix-helix protein, CopG family [Clostridiales bacterium]
MEREQTTIRLPADLKEQVQQKADEMGISFNETVMIAIEKFISHQS